LKKLTNDPLEPSLKLHKLQGNLEKFHAVRLTYEYNPVVPCHDTESTKIDGYRIKYGMTKHTR
jgi:mRNA-degrading endonuclease YafQ of YafQ-DinJ toxin-antitoxin module